MAERDETVETYTVEAPDGTVYGPVGLEVLRQWAAEGRIAPETILIEQSTESRISAELVEGLFSNLPPVIPPPPHATNDGPIGKPQTGGIPNMTPPGFEGYRAPRKSSVPPWAIALIIVSALCLCCIPLPAILLPVFNQSKAVALKPVELSNMKQLCIAMAMYTNDCDGHFPPNTSSAFAVRDALVNYTRDLSVFRTVNPSGGEILGNTRLGGINAASLAMPESVVLFFDSNPWPDDRAVAGFADFHASASDSFEMIQQWVATPPKMAK